jgi:hypothetical protein
MIFTCSSFLSALSAAVSWFQSQDIGSRDRLVMARLMAAQTRVSMSCDVSDQATGGQEDHHETKTNRSGAGAASVEHFEHFGFRG